MVSQRAVRLAVERQISMAGKGGSASTEPHKSLADTGDVFIRVDSRSWHMELSYMMMNY